jgi:hypothetical protein
MSCQPSRPLRTLTNGLAQHGVSHQVAAVVSLMRGSKPPAETEAVATPAAQARP